ncbi:hypothetical protein F5890DRAFT_1521025 [Lentinula detonsa]|uniref:Mid2 domain-containing protein n=1 Tax=Lentinula detonsa TaxID=2804962 RepID=A0AA38PXW9_9AGAR|nr:hypothetical protein F5890DRAFT_1521025 [Lentinula detonsa]
MYFDSFLFISWLSVAGALSISFPPKGTPTAGLNSQMVSWKRDKGDPNAEFVLQKIKLDDPDGPTPKSTPVPIFNSQKSEGESTMVFNRAGLFQIIAVDIQKEQTFFSTEITVLPNPTSSASPSPPSSTLSYETGKPMMTKMNNTSTVSSSASSTTTGTSISSGLITSSKTPVPSAPNSDKSTTTDDRLTKNTTAIIGGVVGAIGLAFVLGVTLLCFRYRTRRRTAQFVQTKIARDFIISNTMEDQWDFPEKEKGADQYPSAFFPPTRRGTLRPQDSVSNIQERHAPSILPPIPAARHFASSMLPSSVSSTSSTRRARDRKTSSLSLSTQSFSDNSAASGSQFSIPVLPPRTRTDRQMLIEEDIQQLQARMLFLQGNGARSSTVKLENEEELKQIDRKVELLKKVHESDWAMGLTDETPVGRF